jgi:hypothetical protein
MKTKINYTVQIDIIATGALFLISYYFSESLKESKLGFLWAIFCIAIILLGFWKMVIYEVVNNPLKIKNFIGLITTTYDLGKLKKYTVKKHNLISNKLIFSGLIVKSDKYQNPRTVTLEFSDQSKVTIRENLIRHNKFNLILKEIKMQKKNNA